MSDSAVEAASLSKSPAFQRLKYESIRDATGGVVHDFNNHLAAIQGNNKLLLQQLDAESTLTANAQRIQDATDLALDLIERLSIYTGHMGTHITTFELGEFLVSSHAALQESTSPPNAVTHNVDASCPQIAADAKLLRVVLECLVSNARESLIGTEGTIAVSAGISRPGESAYFYFDFSPPQTPSVFVEVRDSGCGMSPSVQDRIFDPFFSTKIRGHDMGLPYTLVLHDFTAGTSALTPHPGAARG